MRWVGVQEYTDDTAELRRQVDALGGIAALQDPERQLQAIMELEQFVSAVCHLLISWASCNCTASYYLSCIFAGAHKLEVLPFCLLASSLFGASLTPRM